MSPSPDSAPAATTSPPEPTNRDMRRLASGADWWGYLTLENIHAVHARLADLIGDGTRFTSVYSNQDFWALRPPEIRTGCVARELELCTEPFEGKPCGSIEIGGGGYLYHLVTEVADQGAARALPEKDRPPYLHFKHDRIEITEYAPAGNKFFQVYAAEERDL